MHIVFCMSLATFRGVGRPLEGYRSRCNVKHSISASTTTGSISIINKAFLKDYNRSVVEWMSITYHAALRSNTVNFCDFCTRMTLPRVSGQKKSR